MHANRIFGEQFFGHTPNAAQPREPSDAIRIDHILQVLGCSNALMLFLPLLLLSSGQLYSVAAACTVGKTGDTCSNWPVRGFVRVCACAILSHWVSLIVVGLQLITNNVVESSRAGHMRYNTRHMWLPASLTALGTLQGVAALWVYIAGILGENGVEVHLIMGIAVSAGVSFIANYVSCIFGRSSLFLHAEKKMNQAQAIHGVVPETCEEVCIPSCAGAVDMGPAFRPAISKAAADIATKIAGNDAVFASGEVVVEDAVEPFDQGASPMTCNASHMESEPRSKDASIGKASRISASKRVSISVIAPDGTNIVALPTDGVEGSRGKGRHTAGRSSLPDVGLPRRQRHSFNKDESSNTTYDVSPTINVWDHTNTGAPRHCRTLKRGSAPTLTWMANSQKQPSCPQNTLRPASPVGSKSESEFNNRLKEALTSRQRALSCTINISDGAGITQEDGDSASLGGTTSPTSRGSCESSIAFDDGAATALAPVGQQRFPLGSASQRLSVTTRLSVGTTWSSQRSGSALDEPEPVIQKDPINYDKILNRRKSQPDPQETVDTDDLENQILAEADVDSDTSDTEHASTDADTDVQVGVAREKDSGEVWSCGQVEVPIWLLDRMKKGGWMPPDDQTDAASNSVGSSTRNRTRSVAFADEVHTSLECVSEPNDGSSSPSDEDSNAGDAEHGSFADKSRRRLSLNVGNPVIGNTFWKVPLPTRRSSVSFSADASFSGGDSATEQAADGADAENDDNSASKRRLSMRRRSSVSNALGYINDESVKEPGLYAVPLEEDGTGEIIEIRRRSLVMSTSMLSNIMQAKNEQGRAGEVPDHDGGDDEVVLPLFRPPNQHIPRQCQCQVDPVTGFVIHTCMTPATTACDNTHAAVSYVCSGWNTRSASRRNSPPRSRRSSVRPEDKAPSMKKRIRNASMLELIGHNGPAPARRGTDQPGTRLKGPGDNGSIEEEDDFPAENELAVSFANIQGGVASRKNSALDISGSSTSDGFGMSGSGTWSVLNSPGEGVEDASVFVTPERRVEDAIGQRFDLVEPHHLASMLHDDDLCGQLLIVDVRGRDWVGGHIPSSINLRTTEVVRHPSSILFQCRRSHIRHVVFTCMYSVLRARKCVVAVETQQEDELKAGHGAHRVRISLLAGGMHAWVNCFADKSNSTSATPSVNRSLVDSFDPHMWSDGGPSQGGLVHVMDALWTSGGQKALSDALTQELQTLATRWSPRASQENSTCNSRRASACSNESQHD